MKESAIAVRPDDSGPTNSLMAPIGRPPRMSSSSTVIPVASTGRIIFAGGVSATRSAHRLVGITVPEWITLLNSKIFFFVSKQEADVLAKSYATYDNLLLEIDTAAMLATYAEYASLCRINSGSFLYTPRPRGRASFIPLQAYNYKNKRDTPAELSIDLPIPEILRISSIAA
jgi:hypothetical protein